MDSETAIIEVKSVTGNTKSANTILKNKSIYGINRCFKLSANNIGVADKKYNTILYGVSVEITKVMWQGIFIDVKVAQKIICNFVQLFCPFLASVFA